MCFFKSTYKEEASKCCEWRHGFQPRDSLLFCEVWTQVIKLNYMKIIGLNILKAVYRCNSSFVVPCRRKLVAAAPPRTIWLHLSPLTEFVAPSRMRYEVIGWKVAQDSPLLAIVIQYLAYLKFDAQ
jgi:hypothetical protein